MELLFTKHFLITLVPLFAILIPYLVLCISSLVGYHLKLQNPFGSHHYYVPIAPCDHLHSRQSLTRQWNFRIMSLVILLILFFTFCRCFSPCQWYSSSATAKQNYGTIPTTTTRQSNMVIIYIRCIKGDWTLKALPMLCINKSWIQALLLLTHHCHHQTMR